MRQLIKIFIVLIAGTTTVQAEDMDADYGIDWSCADLYGDDFLNKTEGTAGISSCLAGAGLFEEALQAASEDPNAAELHALLSFLDEAGGDTAPLEETHPLAVRAREGRRGAAMWLLIGRPEEAGALLSAPQRLSAVGDFLGMPLWFKERYATVLAKALAIRRDREAALALGSALEDAYPAQTRLGAIGRLVHAKTREDLEHYEDALDRYASVLAPWDDAIGVEARFRHTALLWRLGRITTAEAVDALSGLSFDWRGGELGAQIDLALARALTYDAQPLRAARILERLDERRRDGYGKEAKVRLRQLLMQTFAEQDFDVPPVVALSMWLTARPSFGQGKGLLALDLEAARFFAKHGLLTRAKDVLTGIPDSAFAQEATLAEKLAAASLFANVGERKTGASLLAMALAETAAERERALMPVGVAVLADEQLSGLDPAALPEEARAALERRAWSAGLYEVHARAARPTDRNAVVSAFIARSERPALAAADGDPVLAAIAMRDDPPARSASDFRETLDRADAVIALEGELTPHWSDIPPGRQAAHESEPPDQGKAL